jgi:hypothetical protein
MKRNRTRTIPALLILSACAFTVVMIRLGVKGQGRIPGPARRIAAAEGTDEDPFARGRYEWMKLRNPATLRIPKGIGTRENAFARRLRERIPGNRVPIVGEWTSRGPVNIGGRTKALAIDVRDENIILAGGVSSGMWKSVDGGKTWRKTTAPGQLHSVSCIVQNTAPGHENVWYYGTGEGTVWDRGGSAAGPSGTNAFYHGDGVFKSTDGGETWSILSSTVSGTVQNTDPFDFVFRLVTFGENGVYAATTGGVYRSLDGGNTWNRVLGTSINCTGAFGDSCVTCDVAMTPSGTVYAAIGGRPRFNGLYRSLDGSAWENISPPNFPDTTMRTVIGIVPSDGKKVYFFTCQDYLKTHLYRFTENAGWTDLRPNLPWGGDMITYGGNMLTFYVKPDDENVLFLGTTGLFRSRDGGKSFELIGGSSDFHVDQHSIAFFRSDPKKMIAGNDGGLFKTSDNKADVRQDPDTGEMRIDWESLNNAYLTTQFYTISLDHDTPGSTTIAGGMQDNGCWYTDSANPAEPWKMMIWGDGGNVVMADSGKTMYANVGAGFMIWKYTPSGLPFPTMEVTPAAIGHAGGLWLPPMLLDPHDRRIMYVPWRTQLWRNSDLTAIPFAFPPVPTDVNWARLENVNNNYIQGLGMSEAEPRRLYYGGSGGLFRLENPQEGQPVPENIDRPNLPIGGYIHCIAVDPRDANKVVIVYPNYGVISIYATEDGGGRWIPVAGNLEEHPNGSGDGPSVRWVSILYLQDRPVYFAGTSVGLFSTTKLDSTNTVWVQEGAGTIGNVVVDMIEARQSDGTVVVGTHGNGVYSATVTEIPSAVRAASGPPLEWELSPVYPNPFNSSATIRFTLPSAGEVRVDVYNLLGERVATLADGRMQSGEHRILWTGDGLTSGTYLVRMTAGNRVQTRKILLLK